MAVALSESVDGAVMVLVLENACEVVSIDSIYYLSISLRPLLIHHGVYVEGRKGYFAY